jgi:hypothetical protein
MEIAALSKERLDRNMVSRKKAEKDFALEQSVMRHQSIPVNLKSKRKNPLWIMNQLKATGEAGMSTLLHENDEAPSYKHESDSKSSDSDNSQETENETDRPAPSKSMNRQQTLFESVRHPQRQKSSAIPSSATGWKKLVA